MDSRFICNTATRRKETEEIRFYRNRELQHKAKRDNGKGTNREDKAELQCKSVLQWQILQLPEHSVRKR